MRARPGARRGPAEKLSRALRLLAPPKAATRGAMLPVLATPGDLREAVQYLKRKPTGVSLVEALADAKRRVFEPRKVAAYEAWGVVARCGERLLLTERGRAFARTLEPETRAYRMLLDSNRLYRAALAWIQRQGLDLVTYADVAAHLREEFGQLLAAAGPKGTEEGVVCFFHLCQAAELGTLTIGKRGQPARLRVEHAGLGEYLAGYGSSWDAARPREHANEAPGEDEEHGEPPAGTCIFLSYGGQPAHVVVQIQTAFELAGIKSQASERTPCAGSSVLVADAAAEVMRRCDAALVLLSDEDCRPDASGAPAISQRALVEIGAASVLYERRVLLLLLDGPAELPAGLSSLPHVRLGEHGLTWEVGIELLRAVRGFADRAGRV